LIPATAHLTGFSQKIADLTSLPFLSEWPQLFDYDNDNEDGATKSSLGE
jgi:hypothetical protein